MTPEQIAKQREEFHKWWTSKDRPQNLRRDDADDGYFYAVPHTAWEAWIARAESADSGQRVEKPYAWIFEPHPIRLFFEAPSDPLGWLALYTHPAPNAAADDPLYRDAVDKIGNAAQGLAFALGMQEIDGDEDEVFLICRFLKSLTEDVKRAGVKWEIEDGSITGAATAAQHQSWIATAEQLPPDSIEVLGFHPDWIDGDFNPRGIRVCFQNDGERWQSARWYDNQDTYINGEERVFGDNPNGSLIPSHWMPIPDVGAGDGQRIIDALAMIYDKLESGITTCDESDEYVGNAFTLTKEEEDEILYLLRDTERGSTHPRSASAAVQPAAQQSKLEWTDLIAIAETPDVSEALINFSDDHTQDNACCIISAVLDAAPAGTKSPTQGMNLGERIAHVGGRTNDQGYIEFGSVMAVDALIQQVLRDHAGTEATKADEVMVKREDAEVAAYYLPEIAEAGRTDSWKAKRAAERIRAALSPAAMKD